MKNILIILVTLFVLTSMLGANEKIDMSKFDKVQYHKELQTPFILSGILAEKSKTNNDVKNVFMKKMSKLTGIRDLDSNVKELGTFVDQDGDKHVRMQQLHKGIPVRGAEFYLEISNEKVVNYSGKIIANIEINSQENYSSDEIIEIALSSLKDNSGIDNSSAEKVIFITENREHKLAYRVSLTGDKAAWISYVDSYSGEILLTFDNIKNVVKTSYYYGNVDITMNGSQYYDSGRNTWIQNSSGSYYTEGSNTTQNKKCVSSLYSIEGTLDFFEQKFSRDSWDGNGGQVPIVYDSSESAYFYMGKITIGDIPSSSTMGFAGAIDVIAHEFSHGFCQYTSNLEYYNESGALNEANSDIMGNSVDRWMKNDYTDWLVGEDIMIGQPNLRSMIDPSESVDGGGQPEYYSERYTGTQDNGGVHINNSLGNKFFQLLVDGGTWYSQNNNNVTVSGIGDTDALNIWYRAMTTKFTANTDYFEARDLVISCASELFGANSEQVTQVKNAWAAVGIGSPADDNGGGGNTNDDTFEPNDATSSAHSVTSGNSYDSYIYDSSDVDYYKFVAGSNGSLSLSLGNLPADYDMYLYNSSNSELAKAYTTNNPETITHDITAGTYYIKVNGYNGANSSSTAYSLTVNFDGETNNEPEDPYEPNNTTSEAYLVTSGNTYNSYLYESGDVDYYKFSVSESGTVDLELGNLPADYDMYLYNSSNSELAKAYTTNNPETISQAVSAGTYYVKINGYNNAFDSNNMYYLKYTFTSDNTGGGGEPQWFISTLSSPEETPHPYANNQTYQYQYSKSGAMKVAVHFSEFYFEENYDFVKTYDSSNSNINTYSGEKSAFWTQVDGDFIKIQATSDYSYTYNGYVIDKVAYYSDQQIGLFAGETLGDLNSLDEDAVIKVKNLNITNYPNPFSIKNGERGDLTRISFELFEESNVEVTIFNVRGEKVIELANETCPAGINSFVWNAKDSKNKTVGTGVYFYKVKANNKAMTHKMLLIK